MSVSPDILVSSTYSKVMGVGWVHKDGVQSHLLIPLLHHHQFTADTQDTPERVTWRISTKANQRQKQ